MGSDTTDEAGDPSSSSQLNRAKYSALIPYLASPKIAAAEAKHKKSQKVIVGRQGCGEMQLDNLLAGCEAVSAERHTLLRLEADFVTCTQ